MKPVAVQQDPLREALWAKVINAFSLAEVEEAEKLVSEYNRSGGWLDHAGEVLYDSREYALMRLAQAEALGLSEADTERRERLHRSVGHEKQSEIQKVLVEAQAWLESHPDDDMHGLIDLAQSKLETLRLIKEALLSVADELTTEELAFCINANDLDDDEELMGLVAIGRRE